MAKEISEGLLNKVAEMKQNENIKSATCEELDKRANVNFDENIFKVGDTFTIPESREEVNKVLISEVFTTLTNREGKHPVGNAIVVEVTNDNTDGVTYKKFRVNAPAASVPEYRYDDKNDCYVGTGKNIGPSNGLAMKLRAKGNQGAMLDELLGKTLKVTHFEEGNVARYKGDDITGLRFRQLPVFDIVTPAAKKDAKK